MVCMDDGDSAIETHPLNPGARRRRGGYWNEDSLPVTEWETPAQRVVVPQHLQQYLGATPAVLRWSAVKFHRVLVDHAHDKQVIQNLSRYLDRWAYAGRERKQEHFRVLFQDEDERWYSCTIGELLGSHNVVTVFGSSARDFLPKRRLGMIEERERDIEN